MGKGDKTRSRAVKKHQRAAQKPAQARKAPARGKAPQRPPDRATRPTQERMARGVWKIPRGQGKSELPVLDLAEDMVGQLYQAGKISDAQEQAARTWQARRLAYLAELPEISGYKSCISPDVPGYDDGDGDPDVIEEYRKIEVALGRQGRIEVLLVCEENRNPRSLELLRWALGVIERC